MGEILGTPAPESAADAHQDVSQDVSQDVPQGLPGDLQQESRPSTDIEALASKLQHSTNAVETVSVDQYVDLHKAGLVNRELRCLKTGKALQIDPTL